MVSDVLRVNFLEVLFVGFSILFWIALIAVLVLLVRFLLIGTKAAQVYLRQHDARPFPPAHSAPTPAPPAGHASPAAGHGQPPTPPTPGAAPPGGPAPTAGPAPTTAPAPRPDPATAAPSAASGSRPDAAAAVPSTAPGARSAPAATAPTTTPAPTDAGRPTPSTPDAPTVRMAVPEDSAPHEAPTVPLQSGAVPLDKAAPRQAPPKRAPRPRKGDS